jgi:hypothetical protein
MGTTLVEVVVTMFIASIAISGLVMVYADSISLLNSETDKMVMYSEAEAAMRIISKAVTYAGYLTTRSNLNQPNDYLFTRKKDTNGPGFDEREFFYYSPEKSLRWNDLSGDRGRFNLDLIPLFDYRERPEDDPYIAVEEISFTPIDPEPPANPTTVGFTVVRVDMKLRGPRGDSLLVTRTFSKMNPKNW